MGQQIWRLQNIYIFTDVRSTITDIVRRRNDVAMLYLMIKTIRIIV